MKMGVLGWEPYLMGDREWVGEPWAALSTWGGTGWMGPHSSQPWEELGTCQGIPTSNTLGNTHAEFN